MRFFNTTLTPRIYLLLNHLIWDNPHNNPSKIRLILKCPRPFLIRKSNQPQQGTKESLRRSTRSALRLFYPDSQSTSFPRPQMPVSDSFTVRPTVAR